MKWIEQQLSCASEARSLASNKAPRRELKKARRQSLLAQQQEARSAAPALRVEVGERAAPLQGRLRSASRAAPAAAGFQGDAPPSAACRRERQQVTFLSRSQAARRDKVARLVGATIAAPAQRLEELQSGAAAAALLARATCDFSRGADELAGRSSSAFSVA